MMNKYSNRDTLKWIMNGLVLQLNRFGLSTIRICIILFILSFSPPPLTFAGGGPPANDDPCNATTLTVNSTCNFGNYSNANATASAGVPDPGCASYVTADVWFQFTTPASGKVVIDMSPDQITDGGAAIYSGACGSLTLVECDDDDSQNGAMPMICREGGSCTGLSACQLNASLTGSTTYWIRVWEFGGDVTGKFNICVYNPECTGTPTGGTASASPGTVCAGENSTLSVSGGSSNCGITYQWQSGPAAGGPWTDISGATSATYDASPVSTTWYRRAAYCSGSGLTGYSSSASVTITTTCFIIGTGTSTASYPYYGGWEDSRSQFIITAAELTAAGLCPNSVLTSLSFNVSSKSSTQAYSGFTIRLGHTTSSTFASATWLTPAFTTCYNGNYTTALGWNLHNFSTSFTWNGTNNIVVETCFNNNSWTSSDPVYSTATAGNTVCYAEVDGSTGCTLAAESTSGNRPNMKFNYTIGPPCSGTPTGGTASASPGSVCAGASSTISLSGHTVACSITYQWQWSPNPVTVWTNITGATSTSVTVTPGTSTNYRCAVTCTASGNSANSSVALVTVTNAASYASVPYSISFESNWSNRCGTRDAPDNSWVNSPFTGDNSWRRHDDGASASWTGAGSGLYSPVSSAGSYSARFHSYNAANGSQGRLDLFINLSTAGTKSLCFDYINTSGSDVLSVLLSTDGGSTFPTTLLSLTTESSWTQQTTTISSTSSTGVIRFLATADFGATDIGMDNLSISLPSVPNCATYTSPSNGATNIICGVNSVLRWASGGPACFPPTSYDVYFGTVASPPFVTNTTALLYDPGTLSTSTTYYWKIVPKNGNGNATGCATWSFSTGGSFYPAQITAPFTDDFENCQEWTLVNGSETNRWVWGTATAYGGSSKSMYISDAAMNTYTLTAPSTAHFYKDVTFPAGYDFTLKFYWKGVGESIWDYMEVFLAPTSETPVAGTEVSSTYQVGATYNQSAAWTLETINLVGLIGCNGETKRLIFSWNNDGGGGTNPPAAVDNISVTATARTGQTCSNPYNVTLPFTKTGETTNCFGNDYSNSSTASCGSSYESGNDKVYKVLVGAAGCVNVTLTNANSSSIGFQVYNGCPDVGGTTCVFYSASGASGGTLSADINIPSAGYYFFIVDNWAAPSYVNYDIAISAPGGNNPADVACGATTLTLGVSASGDNTCTNSSGEPAAPACWTTGTMNTIWYVVTIPASRDLAIKTTVGSLLKTQIDLYRGNACGSLTYVDCNQDASSCGTSYDHSYLYYQNIGAGTYAYIRVDGEDNLVGTFSILVIDGNNQATPVLPPLVGQDCGPVTTNTNPVCGQTTLVDNPGYFAYGNICDFTGSGICLASGEKSVVWYTININANGNLEFDIVPNDYGNPNPITGQSNPGYTTAGDETDYDFAVWKWESTCDGTGDGAFCCTEIAAGTTAATRCDYSGLGVTGLYGTVDSDAPAAYDPDFDDAYVSRIAATNGEVYVLAISNFANDYVSGFTLQFSGTSPIAYSTPGASLTWGSNTSNDWSLPGNWGGCTDPTCNLNAVINSGGAQPVISANASVQNLTISAGATLTINANCTLTVCGNFVNNGTLTMAPSATLLFNNGSVVQNITGSLTGTNKVGNLVINKTGGSVIINPVVAIDIGGNFTTVTANSVFNANNQTVKVAGNFSTAANTTITNFANIQFNGTIPQTYSNSSGTITWTNVIINNSGGGITLSGGATSNLVVAGTLTLTNGIIYTANPPLLIMNAGSSVSGGGTSSFVDGPMQKIGNTAFVFPLGDAFTRWARLGISSIGASETFQAQYFYSGYSNTAAMAGSPAPLLNNVSKIEYWQLDLISAPGTATVTLYWENATSSGINSCAALQGGDLVVAKWNGTGWENRSNAVTGGITGSCAGATAGTVTSDGLATFSPFTFGSKSAPVNPLPVGLLYFSGENDGDVNNLKWETGTETNNDYFILEHSVDGWDFSEIGKTDGAGTSTEPHSYHFTDHSPAAGINYYRLKQTDFDGYSTYVSNVVVLRVGGPVPENKFTVFPNPATDKIIIVPVSASCHVASLEISDIAGRTLVKNNYPASGNHLPELFEISVFSFPEGIYLLTLYAPDHSPVLHRRFVRTAP